MSTEEKEQIAEAMTENHKAPENKALSPELKKLIEESKRKGARTDCIFATVFGIIFMAGSIMCCEGDFPLTSLPAFERATITEVGDCTKSTHTSTGSGGRSRTSTTTKCGVTYEYEYAGQTYSTQTTIDGHKSHGDKIDIIVHRNHPEKSITQNNFILVLGLFAAGVIAIAFAIFTYRTSLKTPSPKDENDQDSKTDD
jgi:hypothetical protein